MDAWERELRNELRGDSVDTVQRYRDMIANGQLYGSVMFEVFEEKPCGCGHGLLYLARNPERPIREIGHEMEHEMDDVRIAARRRYSGEWLNSFTALEDFVWAAAPFELDHPVNVGIRDSLLRVVDDVLAQKRADEALAII